MVSIKSRPSKVTALPHLGLPFVMGVILLAIGVSVLAYEGLQGMALKSRYKVGATGKLAVLVVN